MNTLDFSLERQVAGIQLISFAKRSLKMKIVPLLMIAAVFAFSNSLFAGTTGKISGKVTDAENGQPLPGVTVMIEGTSIGAATGVDGTYAILNVPPGRYNVRFSMVGYERTVIQGVRVEIDLTSAVDAQLSPTSLITKEVVISAQRPVVTRDVSNSVLNIQTQSVTAMPVQNVSDVLTLQAGIQSGAAGIIVRGGGSSMVGGKGPKSGSNDALQSGANQTQYLVDGFNLNDNRWGSPWAAVSLSSANEIQVQTGGFNAEYGNVRSGVVNVVTKDGDRSQYSATVNLNYGPPQQKHFDISPYDQNSYFNRPYTDPAVCWTGTNNGAWDDITQESYPTFQGWDAIAQKLLQSGDPTQALTPTAAQRLWQWQRRRTGDISQPDYTIDAGFGGPVPFVGQFLGNLRFYLSYFNERDMFVLPLSRSAYTNNHTELKLNADISPNMKLVVVGLYGEDNSVSPYDWTVSPDGYLIRSQFGVADLLSSSNGMNILYMPDYYSPSSIYRYMFGASLTHVLSPTTFYDLSVQFNENRYNTFQVGARDTSKIYQPVVPGYYVDESPFGYWGYSTGAIDGVMSMGGWMNLGRDKSVNSTTSLSFSITSQLDRYNQVKGGFQFYYDDDNINSGTYSPSMSTWTRSLVYHVSPYRLGAFAQDKLEFQGFIANLGVRLDYANPNTDYYNIDPYSMLYTAGQGNNITLKAPAEKAKSQYYISPRLGISHPITENSKLYFNYGHFVSVPSSQYEFAIQREANGQVDYMANPNMSYEKTVSYELGYEQNIYNMFLLHLAAYYKDISNQPGYVLYQSVNTSVNYYTPTNNNYSDIRGFEATLSKVTGGWVRGFINYTYDVVTAGYFGWLQYYQDINKQRQYLMLNQPQVRPVPQPYAKANIEIVTPDEFGPTFGGTKPLGGWSLSFLGSWTSGAHATYNPTNIPGVSNNVQWVDYFDVDMRLAKDIRSLLGSGLNLQVYLDITNVFNFKYLSSAGFVDSYDYQDYLASLRFPFETGIQKGNDRIGDYRPLGVAYDPLQLNPNNDPAITAANNRRIETKSYINMPNNMSMAFLNPRYYSIGVRFNF